MIHITVNGQPETLPTGSSVQALLEQRGLTGMRLAVERNGEIVPRAHYADTLLAEGDMLEIVSAVGGG
jgi:sulfur carrier protein